MHLFFSNKALSQITEFLMELKVYQYMFIEFNKESDRFDDLYYKKCNINRYKELAGVVKILLTLSHGQASVERRFSENKTVLAQNMKVESIVACRLIKDHLVSNSLQSQTIDITNERILSIKCHIKDKNIIKLLLQNLQKQNKIIPPRSF